MTKSEKGILLSTTSFRTLVITGAAVASLAVLGACESGSWQGSVSAQPGATSGVCNPCAATNPCNPCAAANPCNPCAATNPCNPCAAANPCNPCTAYNPCAAETLAQGQFYDGPHAPGHRVSGNAYIREGTDVTYWLTFTDFSSDEGPDVNIILSLAHTPKTDAAIKQAGYITIAVHKALTGDQSYRLPKDFDPSRYQSVGIWCEEFGVLFGAAQLQRVSAS